MKRIKNSLLRRGRDGEKGTALYLVAGLLFFLLAAAAFVIDFGVVVHAQRKLQASADAAATAGAQDLPDGAKAVNSAILYSAVTGNNNASSDLPNVTMVSGYPMWLCLNTLATDENMVCPTATGSTVSANALQVKEQVDVPLFFAKVFGINTVHLTATATSSMRGGVPHPLNVIIVMDTTGSMLSADNNCTGTGIAHPTKLDCAKAGVRTLMNQFWPCAPNLANCGSADASGNVPNPVDRVGLFVFPGLVTSSDAFKEYTGCQSNSIVFAKYSATNDYAVISPASDYKTSDTSGLNGTSSHLVQSVDWADGVGCTSAHYGLEATCNGLPTVCTYYAGAIAQAQNSFPTTGPRANIQNVIIILSDGDANVTAGSGNIDTVSLSATNECRQGITAAQTAASAGTWVYSIAYGANSGSHGSGDCRTDTPHITGCAAMEAMANSPGSTPGTYVQDDNRFYAEYSSAALGCSSPAHPSITDLTKIFQAIGQDLLTTALLPNNMN